MHFYRNLSKVSALTFDLDDTLYDNTLFLPPAEAAVMDHLREWTPLANLQFSEFQQIKMALLTAHPALYSHDVLIWRAATLRQLLAEYKFSASDIASITDSAMAVFIDRRHKEIIVPEITHQVLSRLAEKYPLAVISNGNVEFDRVGLGDYFQFALRGGPDGRAKPYPEIFHTAAQRLALPPEQILHVGDHLLTDLQGAISANMQACWLNIYQQDIYHLAEARLLPHVEISQLAELNNLL